MRQRQIAIGGVVAAVALLWWLSGGDPAESKLDGTSRVGDREITNDFRNALGGARRGGVRLGTIDRDGVRDNGLVQITGAVIDQLSHDQVGEVEVVFRGPDGEESVTTGADGSYRIELLPGAYRAFVRDDSVLSIGFPIEERLPGFPDLDAIGMPDETAMPLVIAQHDLEEVDLFVVRGGTIHGHVLDGNGRPVANAVVRAYPAGPRVRPALGSDVAETDGEGRYEVRVPAGEWSFEVQHSQYVKREDIAVSLEGGDRIEIDLTVTAGCVIAGKVIDASGAPAGDGAIELAYDGGFAPAGKIQKDGTFRWSTTEQRQVTLRAWPWKSTHSQDVTFDCRDGARFTTTFQIPPRGPDIAGLLVDAKGAPVPFAFYDLVPLDEGGIAQQERTGADGAFGVFAMPAGRYHLTAYAPGRGVLSTEVTSPSTGVRLVLGGTGTVEGTVTGFISGSFELTIHGCTIDGHAVKITEGTRLVSVRDGKFTLTDLPACALTAHAKWRDSVRDVQVSVEASTRTSLAIDFDEMSPDVDDAPIVPEHHDSIY